METVTVSRRIEAPVEAVEEAILDVGPFMEASGFDRVVVDGDEFRIENAVGLVSIELDLAILDDDDATLAYQQRDGIFEEMWTRYTLDDEGDATRVTGTTEFALRGGPIGSILDATVIKRQRRKELEAQFDYLAEALE